MGKTDLSLAESGEPGPLGGAFNSVHQSRDPKHSMHLGRFRVKRTLLGLLLTIVLLSVIKIFKEPTSRPENINFNSLRDKFDFNPSQRKSKNGFKIDNQNKYKNKMKNNMTNSRAVKELMSIPGTREEDDGIIDRNARDHHQPPNPPSQSLFLSDLRSRSNLLRQQCAKLRNELDHVQAIHNPPDGLIVDEKHKLLYCVVPKVACSSWKEFFYQIGDYGQEQTNRNKTRKLVLTYFHHLPEAKRQEIYKKLYKFVFVRHPFLRLLSAYRDKMEPNGSYERLHANKDQRSLYFWRDRLGQEIIRVYHGEREALRMKRDRNDYRITFQEFVRYLVEFPDNLYTKDRHWRPMHKLCYPCDIRYDFIANFETIDTDSAFIRRLVKADLPEKNLHATNSSNLDFAFSYYENVPKPIMRKLYERYKYDFLLFGYNPQPFL